MTKVLIAEDDATLRSAYQTKLTLEGMEVQTAMDGEEALQKANEWNPDVVLLDLMMPKMSGTDFLKAYDVINVHPNVKVVVFTNLAAPDAVTEVMKLGAVRFLPKSSTTPNAIVAEIKDVISSTSPSSAAGNPPPQENTPAV